MITKFNISEDTKMKVHFFFALVALALVMSALAQAGTDTTFDAFGNELENWLEGSLGKTVSIAFVVVGILGAIMRQTLMPFGIGVGCAVGMNYTPTIIDTMFTALI